MAEASQEANRLGMYQVSFSHRVVWFNILDAHIPLHIVILSSPMGVCWMSIGTLDKYNFTFVFPSLWGLHGDAGQGS